MSRDECTILAKRLRSLRVTSGLTQEKLAKRLNISRSCLANYESCNRIPDDEIIAHIAKQFGVSVAYIMGDTNVYFPYDYADDDILFKIIPNGQLDLTDVSPAAKIALIEFYCYLTGQRIYDVPDVERKQKEK